MNDSGNCVAKETGKRNREMHAPNDEKGLYVRRQTKKGQRNEEIEEKKAHTRKYVKMVSEHDRRKESAGRTNHREKSDCQPTKRQRANEWENTIIKYAVKIYNRNENKKDLEYVPLHNVKRAREMLRAMGASVCVCVYVWTISKIMLCNIS